MKLRITLLACLVGVAPVFGQVVSKHELLKPAASSIRFIENKGQIADQHNQSRPDVLFAVPASGFTAFMKQDGLSYQLERYYESPQKQSVEEGRRERPQVDSFSIHRTDIQWLGANSDFKVVHGVQKAGKENFYTGRRPEGVLGVRSFESVTYQNLYDDINFKCYDRDGQLEYDYQINPGANPNNIRWQVTGASSLKIDEDGSLLIQTDFGTLVEQAPIAWQEDGASVPVAWKVSEDIVGFEVGVYDKEQSLTIDPVVAVREWGTYFGGFSFDWFERLSTDDYGNVYISGTSWSTYNIATSGVHQTTFGGGQQDAILVKFNETGSRLWATYYGGSEIEEGFDCAVDNSLHLVYLTGFTKSGNGIASPGAYDTVNVVVPAFNSGRDAFLAQFDTSGVRNWGTFYGGSANDHAYAVEVGCSSEVYLVGSTFTSGLATAGVHDSIRNSGDGFLTKFNTSGDVVSCTYYGGSSSEVIHGLAIDDSCNVVIVGRTLSNDGIATIGAYQDTNTNAGGSPLYGDAFIAKFNGSGVRQWGTYYGANKFDIAKGCAIDSDGNVFVCGNTQNFAPYDTVLATPGAHQETFSGGSGHDGFLVKFSGQGARIWGTHLGGDNNDEVFDCAIDQQANFYVIGYTASSNAFPTIGSHQTAKSGGYDAFLVKFDSVGAFTWGTYYGSFQGDHGYGVGLGSTDQVFISGSTRSDVGPSQISSPGSFQPFWGGGQQDGFLALLVNCQTTGDTINPVVCDSFISPTGMLLQTTGIYTDTLVNAAGCDSLITINLTVQQSFATISPAPCSSYTSPSGNYTWAVDGTYSDTITNNAGCDSILTINLAFQNAFDTIDTTVCGAYNSPSGTYTWTSSGTYYDTLVNGAGCSDFLTINLTVLAGVASTIDTTTCGPILSPSGNYQWTVSGTYYDTLSNGSGCSDFLTVNLTVLGVASTTLDTTTCGPIWSPSGSQFWLASGTYFDTLSATSGCDSVLTVNLTVVSLNAQVLYANNTLIATTNSVNYQWLDCASGYAPISGETNQQFVPDSNGSYAVVIYSFWCFDTSDCVSYPPNTTGLDGQTPVGEPTIYPNPTTGRLAVDFGVVKEGVRLSLYSALGQQLRQWSFENRDQAALQLDQPAGVYFLKIDSGTETWTAPVVVQ